MNSSGYVDYIETLKDNTVKSIRQSLILMKKDRVENGCWRSEIPVIERLLARFDELTPLWKELNNKFSFSARYDFLDCVLGLIIFAKPEDFVQSRQKEKQLKVINVEIAETAFQLASLLESRTKLSEGSGFTSDTYYSIRDVINDAASKEDIHLYDWHPKENLNQLFNQFDLKYWPSIPQLINCIADNALQAEIYSIDEITAAGTKSQRSSSVDSIRAFYTALSNFNSHEPKMIEKVMSLPNPVVASLFNIVYNWKDDETLTDEQLKNYKSRIKKEFQEED